jgi:hypothetical protein
MVGTQRQLDYRKRNSLKTALGKNRLLVSTSAPPFLNPQPYDMLEACVEDHIV